MILSVLINGVFVTFLSVLVVVMTIKDKKSSWKPFKIAIFSKYYLDAANQRVSDLLRFKHKT